MSMQSICFPGIIHADDRIADEDTVNQVDGGFFGIEHHTELETEGGWSSDWLTETKQLIDDGFDSFASVEYRPIVRG